MSREGWVEAGMTLGADPRASVSCPRCRAAQLVVEDVPFGEPDGFERILRCSQCGATNALLVRGPTARFHPLAFSSATHDARAARCRELASCLTERVRGAPRFHDRVRDLVAELRSLGHDLWSFDESPDDFEVWCPNYAASSRPGIVVTFTPDEVRVEWSTRMLQPILDELLRRMTGGDGQPPRPEEVVVAEVDASAFDTSGQPVVSTAALRTPREYEDRFAARMESGYPWLNVSFYGFLDGRGLIVIELPASVPAVPCASTSMNFSGPPEAARASSWDARSHVVVVA